MLDAGRRILTALWVQCLYLFKTLLPITLSADYSYKQIRLVMGLGDWRAWAGLALAGGAFFLALRRPEFRPPVLAYAILFSPTANILFPIGTIMGERLAYAPSLGLALLLAILLARTRHWKMVLVAVALVFAARTAVRNLDWLNAERFYTKLVETSPDSAKSHYSIGVLRSAHGDDAGAIEAYDRAIAIFPAYAEAYRNRGNALARLGRREEAMASYRAMPALRPQRLRRYLQSEQTSGRPAPSTLPARIPDGIPRAGETAEAKPRRPKPRRRNRAGETAQAKPRRRNRRAKPPGETACATAASGAFFRGGAGGVPLGSAYLAACGRLFTASQSRGPGVTSVESAWPPRWLRIIRFRGGIMKNENAFEMATSQVRFGPGVTREVGMDLADLGARSALVLTDPRLSRMSPVADRPRVSGGSRHSIHPL